MKKFKIFIICLAVIVTIATVFCMVMRRVVINKLSDNEKIVNLVEKAAEVINDEETKTQIDSVMNELIGEGLIDRKKLDEIALQYENVGDEESEEPPEKINKPFAERTEEEKAAYDKEVAHRRKVEIESEIGSLDAQSSGKSMTRTQRILNAMSPSEAAFAISVYNRIDINHALSLYKTDKAAAKKYIKERLSSGEISRAFEIYSKYSYLLK